MHLWKRRRSSSDRFLTLSAVLAAFALSVAVTATAAQVELRAGGFVGGGGNSSAGDLELIGSVADPAAGRARGGMLALSGGVLAGAGDPTLLFSDDFEGGSVAAWSSSTEGGTP